ncbi:MAG: NADH-quinone oxidoreductase subunit NuoF [Alphaproteobacteria bacterium]|nr:NADH-quinone oxidoreductase subunit NuoF [Alphaproteobacteria bacterium]MCB9796371.1 NADH-quinone oxidoreductase subunit NuoF [Alphaproteobacteria bacterium]
MDVYPRILTEIWEVEGSHTIAVAESHGRYQAARKALGMSPAAVTQEVLDSGLRGRGGAGFPTGRKWTFVPPEEKRGGKPVYLLCNADESEPGTFKDRFCMWNDPHQLIEGMIIASWALGVRTAYIYLRGEFKYVQDRLDVAIQEAYDKGYLGENIFGTGFSLDLHTHQGAGAYICGEETALISSLEGLKGQPRLKPPFPAVQGVWDAPTIVNNVETLAAVPWIIVNGATAYKAIGTEKSPGTKLFSCSGHINRPGVYEIPLGTPMLTLLNEYCGGVRGGKALKAIIPGGSSVPVMTVEEVGKANMDYESINEVAGSYLGSGGFIVMDETTDMVDALTNLLRFYAHESCGQCTPCREGSAWMYTILQRLSDGEANQEDLDTLLDLANNIHSRTICFFGASAAMPVQSFLQKFKDEFVAKIESARIALPPGVSVAK